MEEAEACIVCVGPAECGDTDLVDVDGPPTSRLEMLRVGGRAGIDQQMKTKISLMKNAVKNVI